ncbi:MAG TPA: hypothetical protein VHG91_01905 [Longimicrobium sp.]|nr:hypothetical protein [Longimicrobium sp.]
MKKRPKAPEFADRGKSPRSAFALEGGRTPRAIPSDPTARNPVWAFKITDLGGPWCWSAMTSQEMRDVLTRLGHFESMTWREIDGPGGSHGVPFGNLVKKARDRLVEIHQDDVDEYFSLRITARGRVWGIREEHVLRVLWWDPRHEVCPSPKKHT